MINQIKKELSTIEPNLKINIEEIPTPKGIVDLGTQEGFLRAMHTTLNGVFRMSPDVKDLVETSNNISKVELKKGFISVGCLARSSSESGKIDVSNSIRSSFELARFKVEFSGNYPGWLSNMNSEILQIVSNTYRDLFQKEPKIVACHAGLECGILGQNYPKIDMISFGPNIKGAHSPDEKAQISSTQKFWKMLLEVLKNIPEKIA